MDFLNRIVGTWVVDSIHYVENFEGGEHGRTIQTQHTATLSPGGQVVHAVHAVQAEGIGALGETHSLIRYNPFTKLYSLHQSDMGFSHTLNGVWEEATKTMRWHGVDTVGQTHSGTDRYDGDTGEWSRVIWSPDGTVIFHGYGTIHRI